MKIKCLLIATTALLCGSSIFAQLSEGGIPPSFKYQEINTLRSSIVTKKLTPLEDIEELKREDAQIPGIGYPQRIGTSIPVELDLFKDGYETELVNGEKIIRYSITALDAVGLMIYYSEFYIPKGGQLFIYSEDKEQVIGAYTHNTNPTTKKYATEAIYGDKLTLEYVTSKVSDEAPRIKIEDISYIYSEEIENSLRAQSLPCMIDVNCPEGDNWQTQKRGVVKITMKFSDGPYVCSGSLVNNTNQDKTPYILSAYHCFNMGKNVADLATTTYTFNYERARCNMISSNKGNTLTGSTSVVMSPIAGGSDAALVKINTAVPDAWTPYYNGWDVTNSAPQSGVIIHHPNGDFKKIATYTSPPTVSGNIGFQNEPGTTAPNSAWKVIYSSSVTEGGSSGSPMFNENRLIVGTLSGGSSTCSAPANPDYYGRMFYHWNQHSNVVNHLKTHLDPLNSGVTSLQGLNYDAISIEEETLTDGGKKIVIFPSPVLDELNVNCSEIIRDIKVIDMSGKQIFASSNYSSSTISIPSASWGNGVYNIVVVTDDGSIISEKTIKQ